VLASWGMRGNRAAAGPHTESVIEVDASNVQGEVPRYLFGQFMEHEHNTIDNGLLAELLQDRKFEEGDLDGNGVATPWVPEERVQDRYWQLRHGQGLNDRYYVDHKIFYGGGASQAIQLLGSASNQASVYQINLQFGKDRRYTFYTYFRAQGTGKAFVEFDKLGGPVFFHKDFYELNAKWEKYTADFTAPEDTRHGRIRIGFKGVGTFWMDSASLMPTDNIDGMRRDLMEALRPMRISVLRYPGGCYADFYDWMNGIGPRDERPETWSTAWREWNSNDFGTDEYAELGRMIGYDGHITTNYNSGTAEEAADWVEYTNGAARSPMGQLRAKNGHSEPYNIKLWAVGNEAPNLCNEQYTDGTKLNDYAKRFHEYEAAMKRVDPSIRVMASSVGRPEWVRKMLKTMPVDLMATSIYTGHFGTVAQICDQNDFYQRVVAETLQFQDKLDANIRSAGTLLPNHPFFAITEFNSWWLPETTDPDYRLANALYFAGVFNALLRHSKYIFLAESCSLINVQGMIEVNPVAIKLTPPYFAYVLYANHTGSQVLDTEVNSSVVPWNSKLASLDAVATMDGDGHTVYLAVVNRSQDDPISSRIHLKRWIPARGAQVQVYELNGKSWDAFNPYGGTANVNILPKTIAIQQATISYRFPAHSVTVLEFKGLMAMPSP